MAFTGNKHIILFGWGRKAEMAIREILTYPNAPEIVIVDTLEKTPYEHDKVHYIQAAPTSDEAMVMSNIKMARAAVVFADERLSDSSLIDGKSLLIVSTIEKAAPQVFTTVEIMLEKHIDNFAHVQVNDFILSHETISRLAVRSAMSVAMNSIFSQLLSRKHGDDMYEIKKRTSWRTYGDAFHELLNEGATLIADGADLGINRKLSMEIPNDAVLYVICDELTFHRVNGGKR